MSTSSFSHPPLKRTIYKGTFIHTPHLGSLEILEDTAVGVDEEGKIAFIDQDGERVDREWEGCDVVSCGDGIGEEGEGEGNRFWFPGFVDTHTHAPQLPNTGLFGTSTLLSWLQTYTFPLESRLRSPSLAHRVYTTAITSLLSHGTTTAAYFATIHPESTMLLADLCLKRGQRAFVGNVCMDRRETCPEYYRQGGVEESVEATERVVRWCREHDPQGGLVRAIVTPRFAPACTEELLSALGHLAKKENLPIQTHISENTSELALVHSLFPSHNSYADVYDHYNLLTPKTVLAHAIHLSPSEISLIRERGAGVSHCPVSNTSLGSGICPVRKLLDAGIKVGLGTDVSGGGSCSLLGAAREAAGVSRILALFGSGRRGGEGGGEGRGDGGGGGKREEDGGEQEDSNERIKLHVNECLYLATRGGAECLGLGDKIGAFEVGMEWDAQLVRLHTVPEEGDDGGGEDKGPVQLWGTETWDEKIAKWMYCGDDRNTRRVYVKGRLVHRR